MSEICYRQNSEDTMNQVRQATSKEIHFIMVD